jgi:hypothetical protein
LSGAEIQTRERGRATVELVDRVNGKEDPEAEPILFTTIGQNFKADFCVLEVAR